MPLPLLAGGLGRLGLGAVTGALSGLGMGFGYGYGVRMGYNSYKPSKSKQTNQAVLSLNPVESGYGMGAHVAEQRTGIPLTSEPSLMAETSKIIDQSQPIARNPQKVQYNSQGIPSGYIQNRSGTLRLLSSFKSHEELQSFKNSYTMKNQRYSYKSHKRILG